MGDESILPEEAVENTGVTGLTVAVRRHSSRWGSDPTRRQLQAWTEEREIERAKGRDSVNRSCGRLKLFSLSTVMLPPTSSAFFAGPKLAALSLFSAALLSPL